jgi:hypothetical protein
MDDFVFLVGLSIVPVCFLLVVAIAEISGSSHYDP